MRIRRRIGARRSFAALLGPATVLASCAAPPPAGGPPVRPTLLHSSEDLYARLEVGYQISDALYRLPPWTDPYHFTGTLSSDFDDALIYSADITLRAVAASDAAVEDYTSRLGTFSLFSYAPPPYVLTVARDGADAVYVLESPPDGPLELRVRDNLWREPALTIRGTIADSLLAPTPTAAGGGESGRPYRWTAEVGRRTYPFVVDSLGRFETVVVLVADSVGIWRWNERSGRELMALVPGQEGQEQVDLDITGAYAGAVIFEDERTQADRISGRVVDAVAMRPVSFASVSVAGGTDTVRTSSDGSFELTGISDSVVTVVTQRYAHHEHRESIAAGSVVEIRLDPEPDLLFHLRPIVVEGSSDTPPRPPSPERPPHLAEIARPLSAGAVRPIVTMLDTVSAQIYRAADTLIALHAPELRSSLPGGPFSVRLADGDLSEVWPANDSTPMRLSTGYLRSVFDGALDSVWDLTEDGLELCEVTPYPDGCDERYPSVYLWTLVHADPPPIPVWGASAQGADGATLETAFRPFLDRFPALEEIMLATYPQVSSPDSSTGADSAVVSDTSDAGLRGGATARLAERFLEDPLAMLQDPKLIDAVDSHALVELCWTATWALSDPDDFYSPERDDFEALQATCPDGYYLAGRGPELVDPRHPIRLFLFAGTWIVSTATVTEAFKSLIFALGHEAFHSWIAPGQLGRAAEFAADAFAASMYLHLLQDEQAVRGLFDWAAGSAALGGSPFEDEDWGDDAVLNLLFGREIDEIVDAMFRGTPYEHGDWAHPSIAERTECLSEIIERDWDPEEQRVPSPPVERWLAQARGTLPTSDCTR